MRILLYWYFRHAAVSAHCWFQEGSQLAKLRASMCVIFASQCRCNNLSCICRAAAISLPFFRVFENQARPEHLPGANWDHPKPRQRSHGQGRHLLHARGVQQHHLQLLQRRDSAGHQQPGHGGLVRRVRSGGLHTAAVVHLHGLHLQRVLALRHRLRIRNGREVLQPRGERVQRDGWGKFSYIRVHHKWPENYYNFPLDSRALHNALAPIAEAPVRLPSFPIRPRTSRWARCTGRPSSCWWCSLCSRRYLFRSSFFITWDTDSGTKRTVRMLAARVSTGSEQCHNHVSSGQCVWPVVTLRTIMWPKWPFFQKLLPQIWEN